MITERTLKMDAVVAVYSDWGIGANGTQPVTVPEDRRKFAELTKGAAVIVGRKTLADFPGGLPLKDRFNVVLTSGDAVKGALTARSAAEALEAVKNHEKVFVIGGERVYKLFLPHIDRVFVTKIDVCPHSDVFFENLDESPDWRCAHSGEAREHEGIKYGFFVYERIRPDGGQAL